MKKIVIMALIGLLVLAGCANGNTGEGGLVNEYKYIYTTDIDSLDYVSSMRASNGDHLGNFVEGLLEYDSLGNIVPAMAESYTLSDDGLTYTFKIRPGVMWVTSTGEEFAEVVAEDWITAIEHAVDVNSETLSIVLDSIVGLAAFNADPSLGIESVGVKALDESTLEIKLTRPESFFLSKATYGILFPVNKTFLESKGNDFGAPVTDSILYNGPFLLESLTAKSSITYTKNENYWDKDNVFIDHAQFIFDNGSDPGGLLTQYENGGLTQTPVYPNLPEYPAVKEKYNDEITLSLTEGYSFYAAFNLNRQSYNHTTKTDETQREDTRKALLNRNFRLALGRALNRGAYQAQKVGDAMKESGLRNELVPPEFVEVDGRPYGEVLKEELIKLDAEIWNDFNPADNQDSLYNVDLAKTLFAKAKTELEAEGVTFPIHLDIPQNETQEVLVNQTKSVKATIEDSLGAENVILDVQLLEKDPYLAATYNARTGKESDYDISTASGWGPDFHDPSTYLNIFNTRNGDTIHVIGLDQQLSEDPNAYTISEPIMNQVKLDQYTQLLNEADAIVDDVNARYVAYAKAEALLMNEMIFIPTVTRGGTPVITNVVPYTNPYTVIGLSQKKLKWTQIQAQAVTETQLQEAKEAWETKRSADSE